MLRPDDFVVATLPSAPAGLSLVLPRTRYEQSMLIARREESRTAVYLEGQSAFSAFDFDDNLDWGGLIVPHVRIEVDEDSLFDPDEDFPALGSLVRESDTLTIVASAREQFPGSRRRRVPLVTGLAPCAERHAAGFSRWQIVVGEGRERRIMRTMPVVP